jgi:GNAT superfamily N-acetyltransferase
MDIRELTASDARACVHELADVLIDAVAGGASLGFPAPLERGEAEAYWLGVAGGIAEGRNVLLGAGNPLVGTVHLHFGVFPNSRHRAEVAKLMVHSSMRKQGLGTRLMEAIEREAVRRGRTLLVLDTQSGSDAESLYRALGWERAGEIPDFAFTPGGRLAPTTFMYKRLA